jgi:hypothetical protein
MSDLSKRIQGDIKTRLGELQTLRDEMRVKLHLASMDLKDEWAKLEPQLHDVEQKASHMTQATLDALNDALTRVRNMRKRID